MQIRCKINQMIVFSLLITLLMGINNPDVINLQGSLTGHGGGIQGQIKRDLVDRSIYTKHFINLFGEETFVNFIESDHYKSGMVEQLNDLRKYNLAELRRLSKRFYPSLFDQQTLLKLDQSLPAGLLPQHIFSTISKLYDNQTDKLKQILQQNSINQLQRQLQKLTQLKRSLEFISRQLTAESDLRQIVYRIKQQASTKWVNQQIRLAVGKDLMVKELLGEEFVGEFGYTEKQSNGKLRYFDAEGNQVEYHN